jgi:hypothetical protein
MIPWALAALVLTVFALPTAAAAEAVELESKTLKVTVDSEFPRIIQYKNKADGTTLDGQTEPVSTVELNGKAEPCGIRFKKRGADTAEYRLEFPRANVEAPLRVTVGPDVVELGMTEIRENGAVKVKTIACTRRRRRTKPFHCLAVSSFGLFFSTALRIADLISASLICLDSSASSSSPL